MPPTISTLIDHYPRLSLASLPSSIIPLSADKSTRSSLDNVYVKHDGKCSQNYAGNKVRKLEFLLADAQRKNIKHVVTLGGAGSNHAVATSTYAKLLGMRCSVCMTHQPPSAIARLNLRRHLALQTQLHLHDRYSQAVAHANALASEPDTMLIPLGGTSPRAALGYINAALELAEQIDQGLLPCPKQIYVACGTMGTAIGLTVGLALLGLPIQVVTIRVTERSVASPELFKAAYADTVKFLQTDFPDLNLTTELKSDQLRFIEDFFGAGYGEPTQEALEAIELAGTMGINLDSTYTGKAFAALLAHRSQLQDNNPVLFWCTLNAVETELADSALLPTLGKPFERYFSDDV